MCARASFRSRTLGADAERSARAAYSFSASVFPARLKTACKTPSARGAAPGASEADRCPETRGSQRVAGATVADPLSHFPPRHAGSERSSLPLFLRARQYATTGESRGRLGERRPPVGTAGRSPANDESPICAESRGRLGERRPPVGTAARSAAKGVRPDNAERRGPGREANHPRSRGPSRRPPPAGCADQRSAFPCLRVTLPVGVPAEMRRPASARRSRIADRAESRGRRSAGLRPASRGSAKPAPMTLATPM